MHHNIIRSFIEQFTNCPKCGNRLEIAAKQKEATENSHKFYVSLTRDRLTINIISNYFIKANTDHFEFSISIVDGHILYCDQTNQFISLYDLDIILSKDCEHCPRMSQPETFHQSINIFYDRSQSAFEAEPWVEFFSFIYDNNYYYFSNDFRDKRSFLSVQLTNSKSRSPILYTPFIPFEKFEFNNKEKLFSRMNSIRLLV